MIVYTFFIFILFYLVKTNIWIAQQMSIPESVWKDHQLPHLAHHWAAAADVMFKEINYNRFIFRPSPFCHQFFWELIMHLECGHLWHSVASLYCFLLMLK